MQEYAFPLDASLVGGLAPDPLIPPGAPYATILRNLRVEPFAATSPEIIYNVTRNSQDWPFPKLVRDERVTLLLSRTGISVVTEGSPTWSVGTGLTMKSSFSQSTTVTLTGGTHWDFCAFEDGHWFATNGVDFCFKLSTYSAPLVGYFDASTTPLTVGCLCRHGERLVMGAMSGGTWFTDTRFQGLLDLWRMKQRAFMHGSTVWDTKWVMWGERMGGSPDGPFFLMMCALGVFGTTLFDKFEGEIRAAIEKGEMGFASMKEGGAPRQLKALGSAVVAYGPSSITTLNQSEGGGYVASYDKSSALRNFALSGDDSEHAWIDPTGDLRHSRLGLLRFRWIFQPTVSSTTWATPIMSFDPLRREHYISNGTDTYLLNPDGKLSGPLTFLPTNVFRSDGKLVGVTQYHASSGAETIVSSGIPTGTTWTAEFQSHPTRIGHAGSKRVQVVEATFESITSPYSDVHGRYGAADTYASTGATPFNREGASYPRRSANDLKITVKGTVNAGDRYAINGILVRYQGESRQHRRGTDIPVAES